MDSQQLLLKALSVLAQIENKRVPDADDIAILKKHARPNEKDLSIEALARAIVRRKSITLRR